MNHTFSPRFSTDAAKSPELNVIISTSSPYISAWVGGLGYLNVIAVYIYMLTWVGGLGYLKVIPVYFAWGGGLG